MLTPPRPAPQSPGTMLYAYYNSPLDNYDCCGTTNIGFNGFSRLSSTSAVIGRRHL